MQCGKDLQEEAHYEIQLQYWSHHSSIQGCCHQIFNRLLMAGAVTSKVFIFFFYIDKVFVLYNLPQYSVLV